ncbi:type I restriction endonuclease subunit S [Bacillus pseudomycoides]|uniref:restriction endonuclease subunit S n=1 Tax=Bacillus pseudomycoides TaxID=64104 RepID=UPI000BF1D464|nr:restriction endonuclease subunit S [Bacillus pseudomycoides]PEJ32886.1 type I restriction endonuclease subunit S [Bacillus pseudomycoides]
MKNNRKPEIRFLGYTEDWDQRKLDSIVDRVKSYSLSRDVETSEYTGYKYIHYGDIHTKVADVIDKSSNLPNIKAGNYELLEKGDLVLADASEDYQGIATPAVITIDIPYKLVSGLHTIALRPKQVDPLFLYYLINSQTFRKYGYKTGTGMKVFGISVTNLLKFEGMFPLLEEQNKIGNFLKQLDDTIALHQQELTTLKQTKRGFLQKMFPKEGESVPEVRFPGFTGDWELRKLSEAVNVLDGDRGKNYPSSGDLLEAGHTLFLSASNVTKNGFSFESNQYITEEKSSSLRNGKLELNDIVVTSRGSLGHIAWYNADVQKHIPYVRINSGMLLLRSKEKVNPSFLAQFLKSPLGKKQIDLISFGSAQPQLTKKDVSNYKISIPSFDEQSIIGVFFDDVDTLITLHQRKLDALKETKKAFLQKMFA